MLQDQTIPADFNWPRYARHERTLERMINAHAEGSFLTFRPQTAKPETVATQLRAVIRDCLTKSAPIRISREALYKASQAFVISPRGDKVYIGPPKQNSSSIEDTETHDLLEVALTLPATLHALCVLIEHNCLGGVRVTITESLAEHWEEIISQYDVAAQQLNPITYILI